MTLLAATPDITYHLAWCHLNYVTPPVSSDIICRLTWHHPSPQLTSTYLELSISLPDTTCHLIQLHLSHLTSLSIICHLTWHLLSSHLTSTAAAPDPTYYLIWPDMSHYVTPPVISSDINCHLTRHHLKLSVILLDITCHLTWYHLSTLCLTHYLSH